MPDAQKVYPIKFDAKHYSRQFQTDPAFHDAWQRVLAQLRRDNVVGHCQCPGHGERPICVRQTGGNRYHLAKYRDTGPDHAKDCIYFAAQTEDDGDASASHAPGDRATARSPEAIRLAIGLHIRAEPAPGGQDNSSPRVRGRQPLPISELSHLLWLLWTRAGLNEWRAERSEPRNLFSINRCLREAADGIQVNGAALLDHLLVGALRSDEEGSGHNREIQRRAEGKAVRLLVVAKMAKPDGADGLKQLRIANFHGIPRLFISGQAKQRAEREFKGELQAWRQEQGTMVLAQIEAVKDRPFWRVVDCALMLVNRDLVGQPRGRGAAPG